MNKCIFIGNLGKDVEVRTFDNGDSIGNIPLAIPNKYKNKKGELVEETVWVNLSLNGKRFNGVFDYLKKGTKVGIEAAVKTRTWQDNSGVTKYITEFSVTSLELLSGGNKTSNNDEVKPQEDGDDLPF